MTDTTSSEALRVPQVAERLGVANALVYDLLRSGQLRGVRVGRLWRVPSEAVREFLAATAN